MRTLLHSILVTIVWSAAAAGRAQALPYTCEGLFRNGRLTTELAKKMAEKNRNAVARKMDVLDEARFEMSQRILDMPTADYAAFAQPSEKRFDKTVAQKVAEGSTVRAAVESVFGYYDKNWETRLREFDENGSVRLDLLPRVSLSLENGRQKLDFARIHYTKRDSDIADEVLRDYLQLAEINRDLKLMIVTNRDDLDAKLSRVSRDVRSRIEIQQTNSDLWIWAQDGSKPIDLPRQTAEFGQRRYADATMELGSAGVINNRPVHVNGWNGFFQGGNIIVGDRNVFVGEKEINYVQLAYNESEAGALRIISSIFQKPALGAYLRTSQYGGNEWSFHIDLDMVLAVDRHTNKEVALVRSPEALLTALSGESMPTHPTNEDVIRMRDLILKRYRTGYFGQMLAPGSNEFFVRLSATDAISLREMIANGRLFKRLISAYGYETRALPGFGDAQGAGQSMFFGTNAVLSGDLAIIPQNKMPELDRLIRAEYEKLGYTVFQMRSAAKSICQQGGPRCVTETYRKPYLTSKPSP